MMRTAGFARAGRLVCSRQFASVPALHTPFGTETYAEPVAETTQVSVLPNGVKVATIEAQQNCSSIAVFVNAGSRDETYEHAGAALVMKHAAFKSTRHNTSFRLHREAEIYGSKLESTSTNELTVYSSDVLRPKALNVLSLLTEAVVEPAFHEWEVKEAVESATTELAEAKANQAAGVLEQFHSAAYSGLTLGQSTPKKSQVSSITAPFLKDYWTQNFTRDRMCLVGVNVDHKLLVDHANQAFEHLPVGTKRAASVYTGGDLRVESDAPKTSVAIGFNGASWGHSKIVHHSLLQTILGGGESFSAGGPGKGMATRLYRDILSKYAEVEVASAYNTFFSDGGLFAVYGQVPSAYAGNLTEVLAAQLKDLTKNISAEELQRAKNQLKSSVLMNLEARVVKADDVGRQILAVGHRLDPKQLCASIDAVTVNELLEVAKNITKSPLTFAATGDTSRLPRYDQLVSFFSK